MSLHCWAIKMGFDNDIYVSTSIVTMYFEFKDCVLATKAFEQIGDKNVVSYNAFISGLVQNGYPFRVLSVFNDMRQSLGKFTAWLLKLILRVTLWWGLHW